ncbi:MAG: protein TolQ [Betaproteobacteria bacterium]|jgi:biopolymer transport protein TolQ|uniref:Tol-Pal system protein TolQ n=1 Tax=Thiomonas delicata TaxID=364030 RepID=A0A238D406_THIDL|nr:MULTISPECIES: protein TolQ [Thiomonas]MDE2130884.1 protein TolQ [Betaproteobacteria bacterium]OZB45318.1 MAG: protein TolQ [Thiomonas sp. 15-66-11]OZB63406.1 MAG: protein TolQ [Thiomonas sp. 13-66-29]SBP88027.1 membrane spanning protein in TolA-TolQ-TolR complex [Thiomonas delicata]
MDQNFSIVSLVLGASTVVQFVLALLMAVSLASWTVIFRKYFAIKSARLKTNDFEQEFWSGTSLNDLYQAAINSARQGSPLQRIFASGMREFLKLRERHLDSTTLVDGSRRAMRAAFQREMDAIEANLSFLASVASVSPYVGLFGTVWGIMHAFVGLSNLQQVTLATVAPGIAEALVATAIGLFAAIPAVIAYNFFARDIDRLSIRFDSFTEEFSNILQRQVAPHPGQGAAAPSAGPSTRPMGAH